MIQMWRFAPEPSCYPKDIAKDKLATRKKTSLNTSSPVDRRLLCMACRRCPSMVFFSLGLVGIRLQFPKT
jgi:hypothetical protein